MNPADPRFRPLVSAAVHHAVCEETGTSNGFGRCDLYALAGTCLLNAIEGRSKYQPQVGSFSALVDPPDNGWFQIIADDGGVQRGEFHAWLGSLGEPVPDKPFHYQAGELIDFSIRHLKSMVQLLPMVSSVTRVQETTILTMANPEEIVEWTLPGEPPEYLWFDGEAPLDYDYSPDSSAIREFYARYKDDEVLIRRMGLTAIHYFQSSLKDTA